MAALLICIAFVIAYMGGPGRLLHMTPGLGVFNFPNSMLTWDVLVLNGYLFLNITIPLYLLLMMNQNKTPNSKFYLSAVYLSVFWAVGI